MARGWESKAIEEQMQAAQREKNKERKSELSTFELERLAKRKGLVTSQAKIIRDLQLASNARHRAMLERALAHVEEEITRLDRRADRGLEPDTDANEFPRKGIR